MSVLVFEAVVSTGLWTTRTVRGKLNIYCKPAASDMAEPAYYVVGVPNTLRMPRG